MWLQRLPHLSAEYRPNFEDAAGWRAQHMPHLPELNHWVSLSSENVATVHASAVAASAQLRQTAWQTRDEAQVAVALAQAQQVPGQEETLLAEVKTALKEVEINRLMCTCVPVRARFGRGCCLVLAIRGRWY